MTSVIATILLRLFLYVLTSLGFISLDGFGAMANDPILVMLFTAIVSVGAVDFLWFLKRHFSEQTYSFFDRLFKYGKPSE